MALAAALLFRGAAATTSATLYTAGTNTIVTEIFITNTAAAAATATLSFNGVVVVPASSVPANGFLRIAMNGYLPGGQLIAGMASATTVNFHISGVTGA